MNLPAYWRQATFSVIQAADILGVPEDTLRTWLAREPSGDFIGARFNGRVFLSGSDLYFYALVREFTAYGVAVRTSMHVAATIAEFALGSLPPEKFIVVRRRVGVSDFEHTDEPNIGREPVAVIPIRALAEDLIQAIAPTAVKNASERTAKPRSREEVDALIEETREGLKRRAAHRGTTHRGAA